MLSHSQLQALMIIRDRVGSPLFSLPKDILPNYIRAMGDAAYSSDPNSDIAKLQEFIAYGNKDEVINMLGVNPELVFLAGMATDPAGNLIQRFTPYELALGAGDAEIAEIIADYLLQSDRGQKEKERIDNLYRPIIENMLEPKPSDYNFEYLLDTIKLSSDADITAELDHVAEHDSPLRDALQAFRIHFMPCTITEPRMHFNYQDLIHAFEVYKDAFKLKNGEYNDKDNDDKCDLFWREVIGYIQRGLPAVDRQVFAQNLFEVAENKKPNKRSFKFTYGGDDFPITSCDDPHSGLGFDFAALCGELVRSGSAIIFLFGGARHFAHLKSYVQQKQQTLSNLCSKSCAYLKMRL